MGDISSQIDGFLSEAEYVLSEGAETSSLQILIERLSHGAASTYLSEGQREQSNHIMSILKSIKGGIRKRSSVNNALPALKDSLDSIETSVVMSESPSIYVYEPDEKKPVEDALLIAGVVAVGALFIWAIS